MAVVQISKIQVRRGRKNSSTGIPQLAGGEFGWAVDSQELFIGNGSVGEGAPFVGNTKILTENDNIFDIALDYQYKINNPEIQTGPSVNAPIKRSLQTRLDDIVYVYSFGALGDETTDDTAAIQRALDYLYLNDATRGDPDSRVVLNFGAGVFKITDTIYLPPYAEIRGAGKDKTILRYEGTGNFIVTVSSNSRPGIPKTISDEEFSLDIQPRYITLQDLTLEKTQSVEPIISADSLRDSRFINVKFRGFFDITNFQGAWNSITEYQIGDIIVFNNQRYVVIQTAQGINPGSSQSSEYYRLVDLIDTGITMTAVSTDITCQNNLFDSCNFVGLFCAVSSEYDIKFNTFRDMLVKECFKGVHIGFGAPGGAGKETGPQYNKVIDSRFENLIEGSIVIERGRFNLSQGNYFNAETSPTSPAIFFGETGNISSGDFFERVARNQQSVGEYSGNVIGEHKFNKSVNIEDGTALTDLFSLPAELDSRYKVHYFYVNQIEETTREGLLNITVNKINNDDIRVQLSDDYTFSGDPDRSENLTFSVVYNSDLKVVEIKYKNETNPAGPGKLKYWYEVMTFAPESE